MKKFKFSGVGVRNKRRYGEIFEDLASNYLEARGLKILERNYKCRYGEVDIICEEGDTLVFVEVRFRKRVEYAAESIDEKKQVRLMRTALTYLGSEDRDVRFDCILIDEHTNVDWRKAAFGVD